MQDDPAERLRAALIVVRRARAQIEALSGGIASRSDDYSLRDFAETLLRDRRRRELHFPAALFGEPAWDLLLALYIAREEGRDPDAADACAAARVKPSSGRHLIAESCKLIGLSSDEGGYSVTDPPPCVDRHLLAGGTSRSIRSLRA